MTLTGPGFYGPNGGYGLTITGPGFSLDPDNRGDGSSGWKWQANAEDDPILQVARQIGEGQQAAAQSITLLQATVAVAMMQAGMSEADTNAAGSAFIVQHSALITAYQQAAGNPVAGQALLAAILAAPPVWWSAPIAAIFTATLG